MNAVKWTAVWVRLQQVAHESGVQGALTAARVLDHFPRAKCLWTAEGLSHHLWGQLFCQPLGLVSAWEF